MKKPAEKFYVVAERINPQLGTYLSAIYIGKKRINKNSISCTFDYCGSSRTLKFGLNGVGDIHGHYCLGSGDCVYGSMTYYGFETAREAQIYIDRNWPTHRNYDMCSKILNVPHSERFVK